MKKKESPTTGGDYNGLTETFFLTFIGELVEVTASLFIADEENGLRTTGFILDVDNDYYYLGDTPDEITQAIQRDRVIHIRILEPVNPHLDVLREMELPEEGKEN